MANPLIKLIAAVAALLAIQALALGQTSVTLRPAASVDLREAVRLGDIAVVSGADAERVKAAVVVAKPAKNPPERLTVDMGQVQQALEAAKINLGRVTLSGVQCSVRSGGAELQPARSGEDARERPAADMVDVRGSATVRKLIALRLAGLYAVATDDLRLKFVGVSSEDSTLLDSSAEPPRRVEVQPGASGSAGRVGVRVDIYQGDRLTLSRTISVEALVRREGCIASGPIERDQVVTGVDVVSESRWMSPSAEPPITVEQALGLSAKRRIEAGRGLVADDVRPPMAVGRGDEVTVHTLSGGVVLKSRARALAAARDGEMVELRRDGSKKSFFARMSGRGVAVVNLDDGSAAVGAGEPTANQPGGAIDRAPKPARGKKAGGNR